MNIRGKHVNRECSSIKEPFDSLKSKMHLEPSLFVEGVQKLFLMRFDSTW